MLDFLLRAVTLKDRERTGWALRQISQPESVADHSWATALLCLLYANEAEVDVDRAIKIALVHDLAEAETGDFAARANEADREISLTDKANLEQQAMQTLLQDNDSTELRDLWEEHEAIATPEAIFVRDMNLVDMCLQALKYEREKRYEPSKTDDDYQRLDEYFISASNRISTPLGRRLFEDIEGSYESEMVNHTDE